MGYQYSINRPCNCLPDVAQKLYVTVVGSHLIGSILKEKIIFSIGKDVVFLHVQLLMCPWISNLQANVKCIGMDLWPHQSYV